MTRYIGDPCFLHALLAGDAQKQFLAFHAVVQRAGFGGRETTYKQ